MNLILERGRIVRGKTKSRSVSLWGGTIAIDTREQAPFGFRGFEVVEGERRIPLVIPTVVATLKTGDYSAVGFEDRIAGERKSLPDLHATLGYGRERFERELERLNAMEVGFVVVEAAWPQVLEGPPEGALSPQSVEGSILAFSQRYPRVHWWLCHGRRHAETLTFRMLRYFVESQGKGVKA